MSEDSKRNQGADPEFLVEEMPTLIVHSDAGALRKKMHVKTNELGPVRGEVGHGLEIVHADLPLGIFYISDTLCMKDFSLTGII